MHGYVSRRGHCSGSMALASNSCHAVTATPRKVFSETSGEREPLQSGMVASLRRWEELAKLVNLVARVKNGAYESYRSCDSQQRNSCNEMTKRRFTPVDIQGVQISLFYERKEMLTTRMPKSSGLSF